MGMIEEDHIKSDVRGGAPLLLGDRYEESLH
jgi:hypothetical protein